MDPKSAKNREKYCRASKPGFFLPSRSFLACFGELRPSIRLRLRSRNAPRPLLATTRKFVKIDSKCLRKASRNRQIRTKRCRQTSLQFQNNFWPNLGSRRGLQNDQNLAKTRLGMVPRRRFWRFKNKRLFQKRFGALRARVSTKKTNFC